MSADRIQPTQVDALPIGSGSSNATKKQLNDLHTQLTLMRAQATADQVFDPPPPTPLTKQIIKEAFCGMSNTSLQSIQQPSGYLMLAGVACVLFGLFAK